MLRFQETKSRGLVVTTFAFRLQTTPLHNTQHKQKNLHGCGTHDCAQKLFDLYKTAEGRLVGEADADFVSDFQGLFDAGADCRAVEIITSEMQSGKL
jgi:hypothetical protein